ncbi:MAG TPA: hypothetical protein VL463_11400 [Kofleriaceae bacterium]|jgi:hypothetical protein|nr:hypothetical protein [Kofleriaceae bacterium]
MVDPFVAGVVLWCAFALIAMIDGAYLHLFKYRLHTRAESYVEHVTHTLRAVTFPPLVYLLVYQRSAGIALWAATALVVVDVVIEAWDVLIERRSRAGLGGLSPFEYLIHVLSITLNSAGTALLLIARPASAWRWDAAAGAPPPDVVRWIALALIAGGVCTAIQHLWLLQPKYRAA